MGKIDKKICELLKSNTDLDGSYTGVVENNKGEVEDKMPVQDVDDL